MKKLMAVFLVLTGCAEGKFLTLQDVMPIIEAHNKVVYCLKNTKGNKDLKECLDAKVNTGDKK